MRHGLLRFPMIWGVMTSLVLVLVIALSAPLPVEARLMQEQLTPQTRLDKSLRTLRDNHGYSWQVIAFRRVQGDRPDPVLLRLVGFPGAVHIDHGQPLKLMGLSTRPTTFLDDRSDQIFTAASPAPRSAREVPQEIPQNVAQYALQPLLSQLGKTTPIRLVIPLSDGASSELRVPSGVLKEWQHLANSF